MPSVVAITTKSVQEVQNYYSMFGSQYAPSQEQEVEGSGSGIIIGKTDSELLIATNYHVVDGADTLSVAFADGSAYEATVKVSMKTRTLPLSLLQQRMFLMIQWMPFLLQRSEILMI